MTVHHQIINRLEKAFWHNAIPLLSSGNRVVTAIVNLGAYYYPRVQRLSFFFKAVFWACIGLSLGLGIGVLIS
jgi:hypothetical protein